VASKPKQIYIGTWPLGWRNVDLYGRTELGGTTVHVSGKGNGRVVVSLDYEEWREVLNVLLHETDEFLMHDRGHTYRATEALSGDINNCLFVFRHHDFSETKAHQADFIAECYEPLRKAWRNYRQRGT